MELHGLITAKKAYRQTAVNNAQNSESLIPVIIDINKCIKKFIDNGLFELLYQCQGCLSKEKVEMLEQYYVSHGYKFKYSTEEMEGSTFIITINWNVKN